MIVPNGSMWRIGLRERRPCSFAVGSPNASATNPWAASCSVIASIVGTPIVNIPVRMAAVLAIGQDAANRGGRGRVGNEVRCLAANTGDRSQCTLTVRPKRSATSGDSLHVSESPVAVKDNVASGIKRGRGTLLIRSGQGTHAQIVAHE